MLALGSNVPHGTHYESFTLQGIMVGYSTFDLFSIQTILPVSNKGVYDVSGVDIYNQY